ncbi:MAG TPA: hypothetical protein DHW42_05635 [Candidatus Marinimicrobia bacterium]|nr:hypothetical protein [Candidatus Neomarinimicrobiota bacterium]
MTEIKCPRCKDSGMRRIHRAKWICLISQTKFAQQDLIIEYFERFIITELSFPVKHKIKV